MRKIIIAVVVLLAAHVALLLAGAGRGNASLARSGTTVGIVFDVGGRGDKSFNDGAYAGADSARRMLGVTVRYIEPGDGSDRESGLRLLAAEKMDLVMGVGFIFTDDLTNLAREYPNINFAGIDLSLAYDSTGKLIPPPPNLAALKFREE